MAGLVGGGQSAALAALGAAGCLLRPRLGSGFIGFVIVCVHAAREARYEEAGPALL